MASPLAFLSHCVGSSLWVLMQDQREFTGTLFSHDANLNIVLHDAVIVETSKPSADGKRKVLKTGPVPELILNSHHVALFIPGGASS